MKAKRSARARVDDRRRKTRQPLGDAARRPADAPPRRGRPNRDPRRAERSAPQTSPIPRPKELAARPKSASQAKARAKAKKAKAPKVIRPPLRERLILKLASVEFNPRTLIARVPFVVLVIGSLGLGLGITLWLSTGAAERSYQLSAARETNQALLQQKEALERDVLEAQAAPTLAESARRLGMIPSRDTAHLVQDPTGNWIVVGTPKPAEGVPPPPLNAPLPDDTPAPPPPPPPPPAPRVVDPRELAVRVPAGPGTPVEVPQGVTGAQPPVPGPTAPLTAPLVPAPGAPASAPEAAPVPQALPVPQAQPAPVPSPPAAPLIAPAPPESPSTADHLATPQAMPGPVAAAEQFSPVTDHAAGPAA